MKYIAFLIVVALLVVMAAIAVPLLLVWAVNVLWHTNTSYSLESWAAATALIVLSKVTIRFRSCA